MHSHREITRFARISANAKQPQRFHDTDAGYDLFCSESVTVMAGLTRVPTGICVEPPPNVWFHLVGRSSSLQNGLHVHTAVIDSGYRGELFVHVSPIGPGLHVIPTGARLAQLVPFYNIDMKWEEAKNGRLEESARGHGGFGSTGQ